MATTSEIQVTEAYIGLLGRAPDPAGLAYWVEQLDAAIAAGEDAAVALKKLTKDITLNDEWLVDGDGALDVTGGTAAQNLTNAETVVTNMYDRLFDRTPPSQAELDYWAPKLVSGEFTSSEMAVALIQGAGTTDAAVLGFKQEAATYYVDNVPQADFDKTAAGNAVADVNGPISLQESKTSTDYIATGVGKTSALTATNGDTIVVTAGDDTITGAAGHMQANDTVKDLYTSDNDSLTITETKGFSFGTVTNIENMAVNIAAQLGTDLTIEANNASGGTMSIDVAPTVEVAGIDVLGETTVTMNDAASNVVTTDVTALTLNSLDADITVSGDADLKTVSVSGMNDAGVSITLGNNDSSVTVGGLDGTNDAASVSAIGKVSIDANDGGFGVDYLTVSGNGGAVVATVTDAADITNYTIAGTQDVTLKGDALYFSGTKLADSSTAGTLALNISTANDADLTQWAALDGGLTLSADMAAKTVTYAAGDLAATVSADQTGVLTFNTNDTTASSATTLTLTLDNDAGDLATGSTDKTDFDIVNISTGTKARTIADISMDGNDSVVTIVGQNDITITNDVDAGGVTVETTKDFAADDVNASSEAIKITADAINITNDVTADNDNITLTATNEVTVDDVVVTNDSTDTIDITGSTITANDITGATDVALTATNDTAASSANDVLAEGDITVDSGNWTFASLTANDGTLLVSGDAQVTSSNTNATAGVTVTSSCDVNLGVMGNDATVLNASGASGGVTAVFNDSAYTSQVTVVTAGGNDSITADNESVFNIQTGAGLDTVTIETAAALSVVNTGADNDTIVANDVSNDYSVYAGDGADSITLIANADGSFYGNDGNDTFTVGADSGATISGGNDTDTVVLAAGNYSNDGLTMSGIEKVNITAGSATLDSTTFASDNTFELVGSGSETLTINAITNVATTIDASGVTTGGFSAGGVVINGNDKADTLTASNYSDTINGNGGNDIINGGSSIDGSNDILNGNAGNDTITGGDGRDIISGGADNDVLIGGAGNDSITGGSGQDDMTGGSGNDTFDWNGTTGQDNTGNDAANDADVIVDFTTGEDTIDLTAAGNDGGFLDQNSSIDVANGSADGNYAAVVTKAEASFSLGGAGEGNDVYISVNAFGSGDAYVFIDADNDGSLGANDIVIILTGVDQMNEIDAANDITL